jgi:two-component system sensor histidine kinase KdpD
MPQMFTVLTKLPGNRLWGYVTAVFGIAAVTAVLEPIHLRITLATVALTLLVVVLFIATVWGSRPALAASGLGILSFNYFFLPPVRTWTINDPENWVAWIAFVVTAVTAGQLSSYAKRRAEVAELRRLEIDRLYQELSGAFERASHAEALKQSEKLKSALLDAVTHDIRTPLTSIKASVTTLLDETEGSSNEEFPLVLDAESRREMLEVINEESDRLNRFVEDLIELAKIEAGELGLRLQWSSIDEIIASALARAKSLVSRHKILIDIQKDLPLIRVDSQAISEVIYTLIDNAAKYSPVDTSIYISARQNDKGNLLVAVEDEGESVAPELRERIFEKFFRAIHDTGSGTRQPTGTGMGLAIAKGIIEAHKGHIWATDAAKNKFGTRFEFSLPIEDE